VQWDAVLQKSNKKDLEKIARWVEEGKLKAVVGKVIKLEDVSELREACIQLLSGKGGLGKVVVEIS
jgi:NADPH:quinone reductase-like Zn-dependent oxidoreductase